MRTNWIWILIGVAFTAILITYFGVFNGSLSVISQDWAAFGSYVSGIMMPILTGINIWVFIKLTKAIDDNNTKRHEAELNFQKRQIVSDLRQNSLNKLSATLDDLANGKSNLEIYNSLLYCQVVIDSFLNQKQKVFIMTENEGAYRSLINLHKEISKLIALYKEGGNVKVSEILKLKHTALADLQAYVIDNI